MKKTAEQRLKFNAYMKAWRKLHPEYCKNEDLRQKHGITLEIYNQMLKDQNSVCRICHQKETQLDHRTNIPYNLSVDHCHVSGKIRGLLCNRCNRSLGMAEDNIELLESMIQYLQKYGV